MSEDGAQEPVDDNEPDAGGATPNAAAPEALSPAPVNPAPAPQIIAAARTRRRLWLVISGTCLVIATIGHCIVKATHPPAPVHAVAGDGRAAGSASNATATATAKRGGVALSGIVVDAAGLAVAGAYVAATIESAKASTPVTAAPTPGDGRFALHGLAPGRYRIRVDGSGILAAELRYVAVPGDDARIIVSRRVAIEGTVTDGKRPGAGAIVAVLGDAIGGALEVKADAKANFAIPNLPEGRYQVYAWRADLAARAVRVDRIGAGPFAPVELRLEAGAIVVGTVIDRDEGTGIVAAIELRPSTGDAPPRYARSGSDGVFRIEGVPTGRWIADAFAPGYLAPGGVELDAGKGTPQLALEPGAAIEGRVLGGDGKPIAGATVRAFVAGANPVEYSAAVDLARLRQFSGRNTAPTSDAATTLPSSSGDSRVIARGELGVMVGPIPPLPPPGAPSASPAAVVDPSASTQILVGDPAPIAADPDRASMWTTGSDGRYRVRGIARGKVSVVASAPGFAEARSRPVAIDASGELVRNVDIVLSSGTFVVGTVTDQRGAPVVGAELSARPEVGTAVSAFTGEDGRFRLGPVTGAIELRATAYGHAEVRRSIEVAPARGSAASWTEDIVLDVADATLAGRVVDASGVSIGSAQLDVIGGAGQRRHAVASDAGTFSIDKLPRGNLRLRVTHRDYPAAEFDVVASTTGEQLRLVLTSGGAVEGAIVDGANGSSLPGLTLSAEGLDGAKAETSTDKAGRWRLGPLRPGRWRIRVAQPGYLPHVRDLDVPAASRTGATSLRDIRIDLMRGAMVGGTVRDGRGQRVAGAHIVVSSQTVDVSGDSDARGEFRIHDAPTGDIVVTATRGNASGQTRATVRPASEVLGLAIEIR